MLPVEIKKNIFWVGSVDFANRDFHGYSLSPRGTTSNAYIVLDEKNVLFDTVKKQYFDSFFSRVKQVIDPEKIDYIVINHVELDHAGALPEIIKLCKPEKIYCSQMALKAMQLHFDIEGWPIETVKTGDSINIGKRNIQFIEARMIHWPDSMFSYIPEDKVVFSNDAFGQNIASTQRYSDEFSREALYDAMQWYYYNIVVPFSSQVLKLFDSIQKMDLDIDMIAPDHGLIFRNKEEVRFAFDSYKQFAVQRPEKRAVIFYDTMWHSTEKIAYAIAEGLSTKGINSAVMDLKANHHSAVMAEVGRSGLVVVGSPTHNNGVLPSVAAMLTFMKGLRPQNHLGAAFGSFGWSGESIKIIGEFFTSMGFQQPVEPIKVQYVPKDEQIKQAIAMGSQLADELIKFCDDFPK